MIFPVSEIVFHSTRCSGAWHWCIVTIYRPLELKQMLHCFKSTPQEQPSAVRRVPVLMSPYSRITSYSVPGHGLYI